MVEDGDRILVPIIRLRLLINRLTEALASTDPQAMSGRGGGGGGGGRRRGGGGRRSDSRPDHSSPAPDQSANRGGRGGRGRGYGSPDAGGSRPASEFHAPTNFPPLSSLSPSASTFPPLAESHIAVSVFCSGSPSPF